MYVLAWHDPKDGTCIETFATYDGAWARLLCVRADVDPTAQMRFVNSRPEWLTGVA